MSTPSVNASRPPSGAIGSQTAPRADIAALRKATQTEQPFGLPGFVEHLEAEFKTRLSPLPLGRPPRKSAQSAQPARLPLASAV